MFPLISIIIVTFNAQETLGLTLSSLKNLKYPNVEVILVDGMSTDQTVNVARGFAYLLTNMIIERDFGIYDAMNKGINICKGEWAIFMNSGDVFYPECRIDLADIDDKMIDVVFGNVIYERKNKQWISVPKSSPSFRFGLPFCHQACLTRTSILRNRPFNLGYPTFADFDFYASIYIAGLNFKYIDKIISVYDLNGTSSSFNASKVIEKSKIVKSHFGFLSGFILFSYLAVTLALKNIIGNGLLVKLAGFKLNIIHARNYRDLKWTNSLRQVHGKDN
jgi:glycosyltransferase involved in cell wall biosynthesis